jgi:hypothetical protein
MGNFGVLFKPLNWDVRGEANVGPGFLTGVTPI